MSNVYSNNYLLFNQAQTKNLNLVVSIPGLDYLSSTPVYQKIRFGDPGLTYGAGYIYGGLKQVSNARSILSLDGSSLTLTQSIEPEQGRGSISTVTLSFVDKDQYMSQAISPGVLIPEILGAPVTLYLGFAQLSFPEEYTVIFQGRITQAVSDPGRVTLQLSDPNIVRKQQSFYSAATILTGDINAAVTTIPVTSTLHMYQPILGPGGGYDSAITTYIKIDDEYIQLSATGYGSNQFTSVTRGARGTTAAAHTNGTDVSAAVQIQDHGIDMALKLMLSGWNGNWTSGVDVLNLVTTGDIILMDQPGAIILPDKVDAVRNYGLVAGDYVTISGDPTPGNNITSTIVRFADLFGQPNRIIYIVNTAITSSVNTPATLAFRSQYDTYPVDCGSQLTPVDVDIAQHLYLKTTFLLDTANRLRFLIDAEQSAKTFIESQIYLPLACYSLTRFGKLSCGMTKPPLADQRLQLLTKDNIIDAANIKVQRAVNNRKFFNEIDWSWDFDDAGNATSVTNYLDSISLSLTMISSTLPIESKGSRTDLGSQTLFSKRSQFMLQRYSRGAAMLDLTVNWSVGSLIEAGDVVALQDNGFLQITNFNNGQRNLGTQLYEVINRALDMKSGNTKLQLIAGVGANAIDKFATWSPSSVVAAGSTGTSIKIQDSFGALYPGNEAAKWTQYVGQQIVVHDYNWTTQQTVTLTAISPSDNYSLLVSPTLSPIPSAGYVVDIPYYPNNNDTYDSQIYKQIHVHWDPRVSVATGVSSTQFTVAPGDIGKFLKGALVLLHNFGFTSLSPEVTITNVDTGTNTITVGTALGFTPTSAYYVELIGFPDGGQPYRYI